MLDPCQSSSNNWKLISFGTTWLHPKLVKKKRTSFSPSLASLYLFEQWLRLGVTSTSSVWLPLQDESLYVLPNCKSLWIKASAKWLNVNVNVNVWTFFNSCVWVHQLSSVWKDGSQNHTVTAGKGSNMQKCWKTAESTERGGFVWRTVLSSTVQNKQGTHEQPTQNKRTVVDHPGNLTQY